MLKAVLFDIDGVLLDSKAANDAFCTTLVSAAGYPAPSQRELDAVFTMTFVNTIKFLTKDTRDETVEKFDALRKKLGYPLHLAKVPLGARQAVKRLSRSYKLAVVTGRRRIGVDEFFSLFGCQHLFSLVVTANDYTHPKPHPEPIFLALTRLGVSARETVYIGDAVVDFEAAHAAGASFIAFGTNIPGADTFITKLSELPTILKSFKN